MKGSRSSSPLRLLTAKEPLRDGDAMKQQPPASDIYSWEQLWLSNRTMLLDPKTPCTWHKSHLVRILLVVFYNRCCAVPWPAPRVRLPCFDPHHVEYYPRLTQRAANRRSGSARVLAIFDCIVVFNMDLTILFSLSKKRLSLTTKSSIMV